MTQNKDLKRVIRARMQKTGEAYTTARAHITKKSTVKSKAPALSQNFAELAGMPDSVIKGKTGCAWDKWVKTLDHLGAEKMSHREVAMMVHEKFKVAEWWSQSVTVGYERIKGLRARGQRRDGSYEATKSRTYNVPIETLFEAWSDAKRRRKWLDVPGVKIRTATAPKSMRIGWPDGAIIAVGFLAKGKAKSSVALAHTKVPDRDTADGLKRYWSDRLDSLGDVLGNE
jgi:hypothetical protein